MNDLKIFEHPVFGELRTLFIDGKLHFCGIDVARSLGYSRERDAINRHCRHAVKHGVGVQTATKVDGTPIFQQIEMIFIPEGDVYRLAARSKLEGAEKFESWIFDDIVPTVMKTGTYSTQGQIAPAQPTMAIVKEMELRFKVMEKMGCSPYEIAGMMTSMDKAYGIAVSKVLADQLDPQLCLFDAPALPADAPLLLS